MAGRDDARGEAVEEFLAKSLLLRECDASVIAKVTPHLMISEHPVGATLVRAGSPGDGISILRRGRATASLVHATTGASTPMETLNVGDHFGDVGALTRAAHPYTIVADEPCVVLRMKPELVEALLARVPQFSLAIARRLAARAVQLGVITLRAGSSTAPMSAMRAATPAIGVEAPRRPAPVSPSEGGSAAIPFVEVSDFEPSARVMGMLPTKLILQHRAVPLRLQGNRLLVGMVLPRHAAALADLRRVLHAVDFEVAAISLEDFAQTVQRYRLDAVRGAESTRDSIAVISPESLAYDAADVEPDKAVRVVGDEVVRAVSRIIAAALSRDASDIHIEPEAAGVKVRFRVHGALHDWGESLPASFARGVAARLKMLSGLDVANTRAPQDGRIGLTAGSRELDLRLSTLPSSRGEKLVLRVFEGAGMMRPLEQIFTDAGSLNAARRALSRPHGTIIVAGPTGSGRSSTLYSMLHERRRARPDTNVMLVEDPIEYRLPGVTQVQVHAGLGFSQVLRASLRQDPDVIAVGETRDAETARMALEAAMSGHLVLAGLHAHDVASVLQRLEALECGRTLIAEALSFVVVQRLARRLCASCVRLDPPPPALLESLVARRLAERGSQVALPRPVGCDLCQQTGYQGRIAVLEWWQVTPEARDALVAGASHGDVLRAAGEAKMFQSFRDSAAYLMARKALGTSEALMAVAGQAAVGA